MGVTPYTPDYQRFTKTIFIFMGPLIFSTFFDIYSRLSMHYVPSFEFFHRKLITKFIFYKRNTFHNG